MEPTMSTSSSSLGQVVGTASGGSLNGRSLQDGDSPKTSKSLSPRPDDLELDWTNEMVKLNIGGKKYYTTKGTLTKGQRNFFAGMFSGKYPTITDEEGFIFIDRNGRMFEPILEFLRTGKFHLFGFDLEQVEAEALYYGVKIDCLSTISDETLRKELKVARNKVEDKTILSKDVIGPAKKILRKFMELARQGRDPVSPYFMESRQSTEQRVKECKTRFQIQTVPSWVKQIINVKADYVELGAKYESFKELAASIQRYLWKHHSVSVSFEEKVVYINRGMIGDGFYFYNFSESSSPQTTLTFPLCLQFTWQGSKVR